MMDEVVIAIRIKSQARRAAEDSTLLYGEAAQHRMKLSVDCHTYTNPATAYIKDAARFIRAATNTHKK